MSLEDEISKLTKAINALTIRLEDHYIKVEVDNKTKQESVPTSGGKLILVPHWNKYHEWPSIASLRNLIFNEKLNGLSVALTRVGKRLLIDEDKFFDWVKTNPKTIIKPRKGKMT